MAVAGGNNSSKVPARSRLEVNFLRVFHETQQMAGGARTKDWTFEKQVEWLEVKLPELEKSPCAPGPDVVQAYRRQLQLLKAVLEADKTSSQPEATPALLPGGAAVAPPSAAPRPGAPDPASSTSNLGQHIHHRTQAQLTHRLRRQLLGTPGSESETAADAGANEQLETDERRRERLLDDMLSLTRQWKDQSLVAGQVIKKDLQALDGSSTLADSNESRLKAEADRLAAFNKRACNCWVWLVLLLVCFAFISMVLFIKIFPKRRYIEAAE